MCCLPECMQQPAASPSRGSTVSAAETGSGGSGGSGSGEHLNVRRSRPRQSIRSARKCICSIGNANGTNGTTNGTTQRGNRTDAPPRTRPALNPQRRRIDASDVADMMRRYLPQRAVSEGLATVSDISLYHRAMMHRSCGAGDSNNERLEFLGDSVLSLIVSSYLFERYPNEQEGFMTRMRTKLVNGAMLADLCARATPIPRHIELSGNRGIGDLAQADPNILEDAFEAFLAALYLDRGFDVARSWLVGLLESHVDFAHLVATQGSAKDTLHRYLVRNLGGPPTYEETSRAARHPEHLHQQQQSPVTVAIRNPAGVVVATGGGSDRREAELAAAVRALQYYGLTCNGISDGAPGAVRK